jgi:amino acid adenylation domain-containing protein
MMDRADGPSLRSGFLASAAAYPDHTALVVRGVERRYSELDRTARCWAAAIVDRLGRPAQRVGVFGYRSEVSYTGALAALMSGAAFVPLNPTFPQEKTASMARQAELDAIIVDKVCASQVAGVLAGLDPCPLLLTPDIDGPSFEGIAAQILDASALAATEPLAELPPIVPEDIAYILFTSGSTGLPKGVPVTHGNACHFLDAMRQRYGITPSDRFSQTFDQTFDLSVFDLFLAWHSGASVYAMATVDLLAPAGFVNKHGITVWFSVPSVPAQMRKRNRLTPNLMPGVRWSLFCGEPLPRASAEAWQAAAPNSVVENLYGPTELTIACFVYRWDPERSPALCHNEIVPIGRPLPGLGALIVDEEIRPIQNGSDGELCVSGPQTTPGYWKDPKRTAERFVSLPVSDLESRRFYRTGDRVMRLDGGDYVFIGRTDHQIKVLGHRVELGEIEAALRVDSRVTEAVGVGWPVEGGSARGVVAFVCGRGVDVNELRRRAEQTLPPWSVPQRILLREDFPLNPNGKVDRNALARSLDAEALAVK